MSHQNSNEGTVSVINNRIMEKSLALLDIKDRLEELREIVLQLIVSEMPQTKQVGLVKEVILGYANITMEEIADSRKGSNIFYKRIMCYILHDYCNLSYRKVADNVLLTNHATIKHHVDKLRWWMANPKYAPNDVIIATRNILNTLGYEKN